MMLHTCLVWRCLKRELAGSPLRALECMEPDCPSLAHTDPTEKHSTKEGFSQL